MIRRFLSVCCALCVASALAGNAFGITGYGVNSAGTLFSFDVAAPANVTTHGAVGAVGFVPEGIDFLPSSSTLYAIDVGPNTSQLYTIDVNTGVASAVGANFTSSGVVNAVNYNLTGNNTFGFDFNPSTLMGDGSMRIRLTATNGSNLRLNSQTGAIVSVDTSLLIQPGDNSPFTDAAAYINNQANSGGATTLYAMDVRNAALYLLANPNNGQMTKVGDFGASISNVTRNIGFDIYTPPANSDPGTGDDSAFAVLKRPDAPVNGPLGSYLLYSVNLATGAITNGALVGPAATPFDFDGGFALLGVPEPTSCALALVACAALLRRRRS